MDYFIKYHLINTGDNYFYDKVKRHEESIEIPIPHVHSHYEDLFEWAKNRVLEEQIAPGVIIEELATNFGKCEYSKRYYDLRDDIRTQFMLALITLQRQ